MAALTVQGGLVKNTMKGGVYKKPPYSRPPPLMCFFLLERHYLHFLFADTLSANKKLFADSQSANKELFADSQSANKKLFADTQSVKKKTFADTSSANQWV